MRRSWYRALAILVAAGGILGWVFMPGHSHSQIAAGEENVTESTQASVQMECVEFPYTLPESGLVIEKVLSYDGMYMEDGSEDPVENVTGLMLYNPAKRMVRFGAITLEQDGKQLYFFVYCLPPDSRCLILEKNRHPFEQNAVTACRELSVRWDYQELHPEQISYVGFGEELTVVNLSESRQRQVTLWYKQYDREEGHFLGGAAYSAYIFRLNPQEKRVLTPGQYHAGSSKVVAVELDGA